MRQRSILTKADLDFQLRRKYRCVGVRLAIFSTISPLKVRGPAAVNEHDIIVNVVICETAVNELEVQSNYRIGQSATFPWAGAARGCVVFFCSPFFFRSHALDLLLSDFFNPLVLIVAHDLFSFLSWLRKIFSCRSLTGVRKDSDSSWALATTTSKYIPRKKIKQGNLIQQP